jgi:ferrochelatase
MKTAIVLFQLGGPDSLDAIEPFLFNLFMDPDIIDFPLAFLARRPLATFISRRRSKIVAEHYRRIGGKSPILDLTQRQASRLEELLRSTGIDATVFIAMRYWHPFTKAVVREIRNGGFERIVLLPLYPQFSQATTLSSIHEWKREAGRQRLTIPTQLVCCYPVMPEYVQAVTQNISSTLDKFEQIPPEEITIVFSAHGIPVSYVAKGDPYQLHIEATVNAVIANGAWRSPHVLCYQSRVGPMKWLQPSLLDTIHRLGREGKKHIAIVPISFVTDHIETLHEINIEVRNAATSAGIERFELVPALNDHPSFIAALASLVLSQLNGDESVRTCALLWTEHLERPKPTACPRGHKA